MADLTMCLQNTYNVLLTLHINLLTLNNSLTIETNTETRSVHAANVDDTGDVWA